MTKVCYPSEIAAKINKNILSKINNKRPLNVLKNEEVITAWRFGDNKPAHAGQILDRKILPNGNKKVRIATAYANESNPIGINTKIYSPSGELLKSYYGIRGGKVVIKDADGTIKQIVQPTYAFSSNPEEVYKIAQNERKFNPNIKTL
jgi:regulator of extracellular matrix RemA (YlzA/DUF370 family)